MPKYIINHSQFSVEDYSYLSNKGYTNKEIKVIWDREIGQVAQKHYNV